MPVRIKFCGMTRPQDAALASDLGADAVGMIFFDKSARNITLTQAERIIDAINPLCSPVAVVVNPETGFVEEMLSRLDLHLIQFHGDESPEFCEQFSIPYIKAVRIREDTRLPELQEQYSGARALLLDTYDRKLVGGTGRAFNWELLQRENAYLSRPQLILAGGLGPDNVVDAVRHTGVATLDVNSGVESEPGVKDQDKNRDVVKRLTQQ